MAHPLNQEPARVFSGREILSAPDEALVCYCQGVSKAAILAAKAAGAQDLAAVKTATGACRQGRCRELSPRGR